MDASRIRKKKNCVFTNFRICVDGASIASFCAKILLSFSHADDASEANWHKDKRIINWQPFMHSLHDDD